LGKPAKRQRLDQLLVARDLASTRSRARDLILSGAVSVDGQTVTKPGEQVSEDQALSVDEDARPYVSRSGVKLAAALDAFGFLAQDRTVLDLGASTGGFTHVLLDRGAARIFAVEVGRSQMHPILLRDPRVVSLEGLDARDLDAGTINEPITAVVADLSFISLTLALPVPLELTVPDAWLVALIKPQFELEQRALGKGGVVRDEAARERAVEKIRDWVAAQKGWLVSGVVPSPIEGAKGNQEYLIGAERVV